eukprot:TRINITY_DN4834_c0_g1_i1.p1 TRINITY_DN4834_c0_g1~~TRINITY_DN4834_c0_g1_i1.p1  ORF type:complete len:177 (+),score=47.50 TRINITY_DN4834_c0_g1_i1:15-545(+)
MRTSFLLLGAACLVYHVAEATIAITVGALTLTAAQTTAIAGVAALAAAKGLLLGALLSRRGSSSRRSHYRGRRGLAAEEEVEGAKLLTIEMVAALEPEHCFKRLFCAAATGRLNNPELEQTLNLVKDAMVVEPYSPYTSKYTQAALFGASRKDIAKCEHHFQCSASMDLLASVFQN